MKLNSNNLKNLIIEVISEATRRDFLKKSGALAGLAAVGGLANPYDTSKKSEYFDSIIGRPEPPGSRDALLSFQFVPDLPYYVQAPAKDGPTKNYFYVLFKDIFVLIERNPEIYADVDYAMSRYDNWNPKDLYDHIYGKLPTWANETDPDPMSMKMTKSIRAVNKKTKETVSLKILPLSWTIALQAYINKMEKIIGMLEESETESERYRTLLYWNTSREDWKYVSALYENLQIQMEQRPYIMNPDYGKSI